MLLDVLLIATMVLLNGLLAATEMALVSSRRSQLQVKADGGDRRAAMVIRAKDDPGESLATIQIGITLVGTLASAIGGAEAMRLLMPLLEPLPVVGGYAGQIALGLVVFGITIALLLFGELVPKQLALIHAERFSLLMTRPLQLLGRITYLPMRALNGTADAILRILPGQNLDDENTLSEEELELMVQQAAAEGTILPIEERLIQRIFAYADRRVRDVMSPRNEIVALNVATSPDELLQIARDVGFSRYPVFEDNLDQPLGYVHVKDLIWASEENSLRPFLRPLVYIPETASLPNAFSTLTKARRHVALVLDEYGGTEGLLTLEDLLEVIVGEIEDEHSPVTELLRPRKDGTWLLEGSVPVAELEDLLGVEFSSSEAYVTLAGYLMTELGRLPEEGETLKAHGFLFTVTEIDRLRIARVRIESAQKKRTSAPHDA